MPIINGEHRYHVAVAVDQGKSKLARCLAFWDDLLELHEIHASTPGTFELPPVMIRNLSTTWAEMATDYGYGDLDIRELRGFAEAFTSAAGFNTELSCWAQDAFDWIEGGV